MAEPEDMSLEPEQAGPEPSKGPGDDAPGTTPDDTIAGETAELPGHEDAPTERRPPVAAADAPQPEGEPPHLRDVTGTIGDYLRSRLTALAGAVRAHRLAAALAAVAAIAAVVAVVALATSAPSLPSEELVSDDAAARLETPAYSSGSFGRDDIIVPREVDVRSIARDGSTGEAVADVMVTYSGSHGISAEKAATLRYSATGGAWALVGEPENVRVSWHTTEGVDEERVIKNAGSILERADRALGQDDAEGPTLSELYAGASVQAEASAPDVESQTQVVELLFTRESAYERYECRMAVSFAFRSASGQWEIEGVSVEDGARERSLEPLVGTWTGTFQSQEADGEKCLAARGAGLVVTISSVRSEAGVEQVSGTVSGVAHYHAAPSSDTAASDGDTPFSDVPFTAALVEESDGTLVFEGALPEDVGGTVTLSLAFGSADDPSRAVARVTTTYVHEGSFFFVPFDETFTYEDLFSLVRSADAE